MKRRVTLTSKHALHLHVALVGLGGGAAAAYAFLHLPGSDIPLLLLLLGLTVVAQAETLPLFGENSVSMAYALTFIALLTHGPEGAVLVNLVSGLVHAVYPKRRPWVKVLFNLGALSGIGMVSGAVYVSAGGTVPTSDMVGDTGPALLAGLTYFVLNTSTVSLAMSLATGQRFLQVWNINHRWLLAHYLAVAVIGMAIATAYRIQGLSGVLIFSPALAVPWVAARMYVQKTRDVQQRNAQLEQANQTLRQAYESLLRRLQEPGEGGINSPRPRGDTAIQHP